MSDATPPTAQAAAILKVGSITETLKWYQLIGFEVQGAEPDPDPTWAEVSREGLVLQFLSGETPWDGSPRFTGSLYVHTASVRRVYGDVKDKIDIEWGVEERPWGVDELTLKDPDGYFITFTESR